MANINYPNTFTAGTTARASDLNENFDAVSAQVNGNLGAGNLANDAVTTVKIADANVTDAKVAAGIDAAKLADGSVSNAEFQHLNGVTSAIQTQLDSKQATFTTEIFGANVAALNVVSTPSEGAIMLARSTTTAAIARGTVVTGTQLVPVNLNGDNVAGGTLGSSWRLIGGAIPASGTNLQRSSLWVRKDA